MSGTHWALTVCEGRAEQHSSAGQAGQLVHILSLGGKGRTSGTYTSQKGKPRRDQGFSVCRPLTQ